MAKQKWKSQKKDLRFYVPSKKEYKKFIDGEFISNNQEEEKQLSLIVGVEKVGGTTSTPTQTNTDIKES